MIHSIKYLIEELLGFNPIDYDENEEDIIDVNTINKIIKYKPKTKRELYSIIKFHFDNNLYNLNDIDISEIKDLSRLFEKTDLTNVDISDWDVSNVRNFHKMFMNSNIIGFKNSGTDLSKWNVSLGVDFSLMFEGCKDFLNCKYGIDNLCDISDWDVRNGSNFDAMFRGCINLRYNYSLWEDKIDYTTSTYYGMFEGVFVR